MSSYSFYSIPSTPMEEVQHIDIQHIDNGKKGIFYVEKDHENLAEMVYSWDSFNQIVILHTQVSDKLQGLGVGKELVAAAVKFARQKHTKILPLCPFAKIVFDKTPEYEDVLAH